MRVLTILLVLALASVPTACARHSAPADPGVAGSEAPPPDSRGGSNPIAVILIVGLLAVVLIGASISSADDPWDDLERP